MEHKREIYSTVRLQAASSTTVQAPMGVTSIMSDTTAECRWWNSLSPQQRQALARGAKHSGEMAVNDWLDIGETNRMRILDAAYAVECWLNPPESARN